MLKLLILINFVLLVLSLFGSLFLVYKDKGQGKRVLFALSTRVSLALLLMVLIGYGIASGKIGSQAPWDSFPPQAEQHQHHKH